MITPEPEKTVDGYIIKLIGLADVNREVFQKLVKDAVELNRAKGDPTKGK